MAYFDVFNGDADGLCALHQLRLHCPRDAALVTGVKRAIRLLDQVQAQAGDTVTVLDLSINANAAALKDLLEKNVRVEWFDHHTSQPSPYETPLNHPLLRTTISSDPQVCTAALVDRQLDGRYRRWAIVAAYGDNLPRAARRLALSLQLSARERHALARLGTLLNYNAYGDHIDKLIIHPAELYLRLHRHLDPLMFLSVEPVLRKISTTLQSDLQSALAIPADKVAGGRVLYLPDAAWSRRVIGTLANHLARDEPELAHAVLVPGSGKTWRVSVRAPLRTLRGADEVCLQFRSGGGRPAAAGIDALPDTERSSFIQQFERQFGGA